jgi:hypothetical protein
MKYLHLEPHFLHSVEEVVQFSIWDVLAVPGEAGMSLEKAI